MNEFLTRLRVFTIDLRSLAAFRVGLALLILIDLAQRSGNLRAHYSSDGVLPLAAIPDDILARFGASWIAIHRLSDNAWFQATLFCIAAAFALCLLVGFRTRVATVVSWALLMSLHGRNPFVLNGGDTLLRVLLFWSMFLPLGAVASIDARRPGRQLASLSITNFATVAILLQVAIMYWFSSLQKRHAIWVADYSATHYALHLNYFARPLGARLLDYPRLLPVLTAGTFWLEFLGPIVAFCPIGTRYLRLAIISLFVLFHLGLAATMDVGLFGYVSIVAWLPFLPAEFWEWTRARLGGFLSSTFRVRRGISPVELASPIDANANVSQLGRNGNIVVGSLLAFVLMWNLRTLDYKYWEARLLPSEWNIIGKLTGLEQNWAMFAPKPPKDDGWFVMTGTLVNGETVNLWLPEQPLPLVDRPDLASYQGWRWRKYLIQMRVPRNRRYCDLFAQWLAKRWNETHASDQPDRRVGQVELDWIKKPTPAPGESTSKASIKQVLLFSKDIEAWTAPPTGLPELPPIVDP